MLSFHPAAISDTKNTRQWYESQQAGLSERFKIALVKTVDQIEAFPLSYPASFTNIRRARIHGFPYHAYYHHNGSTLVILAIAHMHRDPKNIGNTVTQRVTR